MNALIAVAHGSRDPRSSSTIHRIVDALRKQRPELDVRAAFLDLNAPSVGETIDDLVDHGHCSVVAVPLLLGSAFHAKTDLPTLLAEARVRHPRVSIRQSDVLGADRLLVDAVRSRVLACGVDPKDPTVAVTVAAVGSSDHSANQRTGRVGRALLTGTRWTGGTTCFATASPGPREAVERLQAAGATRVVVAPWFLAPGRLTDRVAQHLCALPDVLCADVIGPHPAVAQLASLRFDAAVPSVRSGKRTA